MKEELSLNENMSNGKNISSRTHSSHRASHSALCYRPAYLSMTHMENLNLFIYVFIYGLFNCAVSTSDYTPWIVNNELRGAWNGTVVTCLRYHDVICLWDCMENSSRDNRHETWISWIGSGSAAHRTATCGVVQRRKGWALRTSSKHLFTATTVPLILMLICRIYTPTSFNQWRYVQAIQYHEQWESHTCITMCSVHWDLSLQIYIVQYMLLAYPLLLADTVHKMWHCL